MSTKKKLSRQEQMLIQIKAFLSDNTNFLYSERKDPSSISDQQITNYIAEAYKFTQNSNDLQNDRSSELMYSKIIEASELLKNQSSMIKSYVKDKIQSNCFASQSPNRNQYQMLLQKREELEKQRLAERHEMEKRNEALIEQTKKLRRNDHIKQAPLLQMESLIYRQGQDYDRLNVEQRSLKSTSIKFNEKGEIDLEKLVPYSNKKKAKARSNTSKLNPALKMKKMNEVTNEVEDQSTFMKTNSQLKQDKLRSALINSPAFLTCFKAFLEQQLQKCKIMDESFLVNTSALNSEKQKFIYPNVLQYGRSIDRPPEDMTISSLTKKYKTKALSILPKQINAGDRLSTKRIISKRIGESNKFHTKQCILESDYLYYTEQQNPVEVLNTAGMKKIEILLNSNEIISIKKEEGNVFQKKQTEVSVVCIKGKDRKLYYQADFAQGRELTADINQIKLMKFHKMSCLLGEKENINMQKFISGGEECSTLDLSDQYIRPHDQYPDKSHRSSFLDLLLKLFPQRKQVHKLNLVNSKLSLNELTRILQSCEANFDQISAIEISRNRIDKQVLQSVLKLVKKCPNKMRMSLDFAHCGIDDQIFTANITNLNKVSNKIQRLSLQSNLITSRTISALSNCLATKTCEIKQLNFSSCRIEKLAQIAGMIASSHKLEIVRIKNCKLNISDEQAMEYLFNCCKRTTRISKIDFSDNGALSSLSSVLGLSGVENELLIILDILKSRNGQIKPLESRKVKVSIIGD